MQQWGDVMSLVGRYVVGIPASDHRYRFTNSKAKMVVVNDNSDRTIEVMVLSGKACGKVYTVDRNYFRPMGACMV